MRVRMLGTGSADGWPNPFCDCASCTSERQVGRTRMPTSALLDDVIMIDSGPTAPYRASEATISLRDVEHLVITHGHPDHLAPSILLWREWISDLGTLHVWGPAMGIDLCRDWVGPASPVEFHVLAAGDIASLETSQGRYALRSIAAHHDPRGTDVIAGEALLYDIESPEGERLLYATDTGPFTREILDATAGRAYDVVLVDESFGDKTDHGTGHFDLTTLPISLQDARETGAIADSTRIVAVHLSHHNPPTARLRARLGEMKVELMADLEVLDTDLRREPLRHLVTGGARSGKSSYAERIARDFDSVTYVATGGTRSDDLEWAQRIAAHRERRPSHWSTVETTDLIGALGDAESGSALLIDCIGLWLTAMLDELNAWGRETDTGMRAQVLSGIEALAQAVSECRASVILVTNEVGMDLVPADPGGRLFRDLLGIANARLSDACEPVTLVIAGRALDLPRSAR
ncbi:MAG: bifunctional adenosylcobinamide kinase/adenosylcobinamide-phosphate guanylyltransferase [Actinomycetes bacterium]